MSDITCNHYAGAVGMPEQDDRAVSSESAEELPTRINLGLSPRAAARLVALRKKTDASNNAEVLRNALRLYEALIEETEKGNQFFMKGADGALIAYRIFW